MSYLFALLFKSFGDVATILGATTNTGIGFLIPIVFYFKAHEPNLTLRGT